MRPPSTMRKSKAETPPPTLALSQSPCLFSAWTPITRNPYRKGRRLCGTDPCVRYYRKLYSPSAFFSADTRRRLTGIFSSTPLSVSSSVPPATGSISSTMDRFTR